MMFVPRDVLRAEEKATDMYAAIDLVMPKLKKQLEKYKGKLKGKHIKKAKLFNSEVLSNSSKLLKTSVPNNRVRLSRYQSNTKPIAPLNKAITINPATILFLIFTDLKLTSKILCYHKVVDYFLCFRQFFHQGHYFPDVFSNFFRRTEISRHFS